MLCVRLRDSSVHFSPTIPASAADPSKIPLCNTKEEIRAGLQGSASSWARAGSG